MRLASTTGTGPAVSFEEAARRGMPADGGLYLPVTIPTFRREEIDGLREKEFPDIAFAVARLLLRDEIPEAELEKIIRRSMTFPVPLDPVSSDVSVLELFHGPTLAFKDFGARFMAATLAYFTRGEDTESTVLVATSGDTGSAVGYGFAGVEGFRVVILYPSGRVSSIQEQQLTTIGGNVTVLEVDGTFDDCQRLVKGAFADPGLSARLRLTSANSINIARLLPQSFYYFEAAARAGSDGPFTFAVPCGNLGNLTAGLLAWRMGLPVSRFIAAVNANRVFAEYLETGKYAPAPAVPTLSNAMDVGAPNNLPRVIALVSRKEDHAEDLLVAESSSDRQTLETITSVFERYGTVLDPHAAVAYRALEKHSGRGIVLGTAHPAKFRDAYPPSLRDAIRVPPSLAGVMQRKKLSIPMDNNPEEFSSFLRQF
jgi:threonine synthase